MFNSILVLLYQQLYTIVTVIMIIIEEFTIALIVITILSLYYYHITCMSVTHPQSTELCMA